MVAVRSGGVMVTGASSGVGEAIALRLARAGFEVFAGVRQELDAERLRSRGLRPLRLDVQAERQVRAALRRFVVRLVQRGWQRWSTTLAWSDAFAESIVAAIDRS